LPMAEGCEYWILGAKLLPRGLGQEPLLSWPVSKINVFTVYVDGVAILLLIFLILKIFGSTGVWTQGFALAS
jgi:hypothetical protein